MALIRFILGRLILLFNFIFAPKKAKREPEQQQALDAKTQSFSLYQLNACPFCVKVRRTIRRENLNIELRDIKQQQTLNELVAKGGKRTVPCLRIDNADGSSQWMYESSDIVDYLQRVARAA
ncbi:glutaredoxin family protein [Thalassotalea mangrovi]|uniref:Glutaredoxin n=1 Tax=Thalassotalea mangrovi TaxID=2572245 RepID=A0A4U1BAE7_9GAMM|nr:glutathione S-transferase N-terminal domain-containing protein [Thalassotalea mangrovi]TKB47506.1 glutaredoxin [Thalassotalea mangrovi]